MVKNKRRNTLDDSERLITLAFSGSTLKMCSLRSGLVSCRGDVVCNERANNKGLYPMLTYIHTEWGGLGDNGREDGL